jgi:ribose transport system ATP-binding protein
MERPHQHPVRAPDGTDVVDPRPALNPALKSRDSFIEMQNVTKRYGPTVAAREVTLRVDRGEVVGLVGANGAGKSVMMRILSGVTRPDSGSLHIDNHPVALEQFSPLTAKKRGVRIVFQELSLCTNLSVYENFYIEHAGLFKGARRWRKKARQLARAAIDAVFPGNPIDVGMRLGSLPIAQQQMVEIARAVCDEKLRLLILDEPTSSLPREQTDQLLRYVIDRRAEGVSFVFISHRLTEVLSVSDRIYVMLNGVVQWVGPAADTNEEDLVNKIMGVGASSARDEDAGERPVLAAPIAKAADGIGLEARGLNTKDLHDITISMRGGEIVGIAGLDGSGQREFLQSVFHPRRGQAVTRRGSVAYVTGDRKTEGNFPLWSVARNMVIGKLAGNHLYSRVRQKLLNPLVEEWYRELSIKGTGIHAPIVSLSGGNQQKVLIARALISKADIIILDDPTRGVDIATKRLLYRLLEEAAGKGKLVIWYSTEDEEFDHCTTVAVMHGGSVIRVLSKSEATRENIINASFQKHLEEKKTGHIGGARSRVDFTGLVIPLASMTAFFLICAALSPNVLSSFGISLLLTGAIPLVFATLSQTFIIGLSHVDVGIGNYIGLINVLGATILVRAPGLGVLALAASLAVYASMGLLIHLRRLPSIVVTLGFSFVWLGLAYTIQLQPGGSAPEWLVAAYNFDLPLLPRPVYVIAIAGAIAMVLYRSRYGAVLRGFGNNPQAMRRSGWSEVRANAIGYCIAGAFGLVGGLFVTAIAHASDANAESSITLLSVAAVVIGGGYLSGGVVSPLGAVFGAITLSLIATLIGFINISSSYVAAVQGGILLVVLALRLLRKGQEQ